VREAILRHLNDLEDYYLAAQRLKKNLPGHPSG
jgi:predicted DNA-binding protein